MSRGYHGGMSGADRRPYCCLVVLKEISTREVVYHIIFIDILTQKKVSYLKHFLSQSKWGD